MVACSHQEQEEVPAVPQLAAAPEWVAAAVPAAALVPVVLVPGALGLAAPEVAREAPVEALTVVTTGFKALRKACFMNTLVYDRPLARAVRT